MTLNGDKTLVPWRKQTTSRRRRLRRWTVNIQAVIWIGDQATECLVQDLSPAGARIQLSEIKSVAIGTQIRLDLESFSAIPAEVRYSADGTRGLMFLHDEDAEVELARFLVSIRPERPDPRQKSGAMALLTPKKAQSACVLRDISRLGASITMNDAAHLAPEDEVILSIEGYGDVEATVRQDEDGILGLTFHKALSGELPT